jgi:hypothetical protein
VFPPLVSIKEPSLTGIHRKEIIMADHQMMDSDTPRFAQDKANFPGRTAKEIQQARA